MSNTASDYWPDFDLEVASPAEVLQGVAQELADKTAGRLVARIQPTENEGGLRLLVQGGDYSEVLLTVESLQTGAYYPLRVIARPLARPQPLIPAIEAFYAKEEKYPRAASDHELRALVRKALQSDEVRGSVNSLLVHLRLASKSEARA